MEIKFTVVKGTGVHRAIAVNPDGEKKVIALYGTVADLAAREIIFAERIAHPERWIVLMVGCESSSHELASKEDCKFYIKQHYEGGENDV